jgi:ADP-heptose:LPS heptosyltransferase/predicted SAM-dependent methyltransferase
MTFNPNQANGCEAFKIAPLVVQYLQGRCLDIGSGPGSVWPQVIGIDVGHEHGRPLSDMLMDGSSLKTFADASVDGLFSSYLLNTFEQSKIPDVLREWTRVLKPGGHLVLYLPNAETSPKKGEDYAPQGHKWDIRLGDVEHILKAEILDSKAHGWEVLEAEERNDGDEAAIFLVFRKLVSRGEWRESLWQRFPGGKKRALVIRYGAIGDAIVTASVLPGLKQQGYHVTLNTQPKLQEILLHDPHVDEWLLQENDYVPNQMLGPFWEGLSRRYDKVVNLSESVEGIFLTLPGRLNHAYSHEARRALYDSINYWEHTHNIAAVPHDFAARFYPTDDETRWARAVRGGMDGPVIAWCVNGSSVHKVYPFVQVVIGWLLERTPAHIVLYGDPGVGAKLAQVILNVLANDGFDMRRCFSIADRWNIRKSLAFAHVVDCVVGPETGPLNAVGMAEVPKVIYLSHSSPDNLTKHWVNTTVLTPPEAKCPCYPCHRLHSTWEFCTKEEKTSAALCASSISPERVFEAIAVALGAQKVAA